MPYQQNISSARIADEAKTQALTGLQNPAHACVCIISNDDYSYPAAL
jgi:hypothetical protein